MSEWTLDVAGVKTLDLTHFVSPSQPLQIMAMRREGGQEGGQGGREGGVCLWGLDLYHARALALLGEGGEEGGEEEEEEEEEEGEEVGGGGEEGGEEEEEQEEGEGKGKVVVEEGGKEGGGKKGNKFMSLFRRGTEGGRSSTAPVG